MDTFARFAFFTIARDASCGALAAGILMFAYSFDPPLALVIGASIAMFFTAVMLVRAFFLTEHRVVSTEPWLVMQPEERPVGDAGRRLCPRPAGDHDARRRQDRPPASRPSCSAWASCLYWA